MTTEEKAKAYDEAIERARKMFSEKELSFLFPELAESEDEKIRKTLIEMFSSVGKKDWRDIPTEKILAWLEKQDDETDETKAKRYLINKGYPIDTNGIFPTYEEIYNIIIDGLKEQDERESDDIVKPKFKVGDWITNGDYTWKIVDVMPLDYALQSQDGNIVDDSISYVDEQFHSFTIADAKEGDVLVNGSNIFIFHFLNDTRLMGYCHINIDDGRFYDDIGKNECFCLIDAVVTPATKEQHDLLFQEMKEASYEWDADKKELKKDNVELTDFEKSLKHIMIETLECGDIRNLKADAEMLLKFAQKLTDKVEPKFKVGDWVVFANGNVEHITSAGTHGYTFDDGDYLLHENCDKQAHLWSITDAKNGDVLACNEEILLFKSYSVQGRISLYCWYNGQTNNFHSKEVSDTLLTTRNKICPATKEQRNLLFQKMKEAGYEYNIEKKELKKVEQKPQRMISAEVKEALYDKPDWSEEDE